MRRALPVGDCGKTLTDALIDEDGLLVGPRGAWHQVHRHLNADRGGGGDDGDGGESRADWPLTTIYTQTNCHLAHVNT